MNAISVKQATSANPRLYKRGCQYYSAQKFLPITLAAILPFLIDYELRGQQSSAQPVRQSIANAGRVDDQERRALQNLPESIAGEPKEKLYAQLRRWRSGDIITVAFQEGDETLQRQIATTAIEWTKFGNIQFDFRDPGTSKYRIWSGNDRTYRADVRIGFEDLGYWSFVGRECRDVPPGECTLNLQGFDKQLPGNWRMLVLHQFGHVLGLMHPFQHPEATTVFQRDDDPGYVPTLEHGDYITDASGKRPGLYRQMAGPPYYLTPDMIEQNLGRIGDPAAFVGPPDPYSVMTYSFPESFFREGATSPWHRAIVDPVLSTGDKEAIRVWYPFDLRPTTVASEIFKTVAGAGQVSSYRIAPSATKPPSPEPPRDHRPGDYSCGGPKIADSEWESVPREPRPPLEAVVGDDDRYGVRETMTMMYAFSVVGRIVVGSENIIHPVCKARYRSGQGIGTAFMIAPNVIMTCFHVVPNDEVAKTLRCEFGYDDTLTGDNNDNIFDLEQVLFSSSNDELDYAIISLKLPSDPKAAGTKLGFAGLPSINPDVYESGPHLIIPQHPKGGVKRLARDARLTELNRSGIYLRHTGDTDDGSSGAPLFDQWGVLIGMHCGTGRRDNNGNFVNNRAVRIDQIRKHIEESARGDQKLLQRIGLGISAGSQ